MNENVHGTVNNGGTMPDADANKSSQCHCGPTRTPRISGNGSNFHARSKVKFLRQWTNWFLTADRIRWHVSHGRVIKPNCTSPTIERRLYSCRLGCRFSCNLTVPETSKDTVKAKRDSLNSLVFQATATLKAFRNSRSQQQSPS